MPLQREGWPTGALDLETDPQGNLWLGLMFQAGTAKFDRKTEKFQMFQLPPHMLKDDSQPAMVGVQNWTVDNRIWLQDPARRGIYRMDVTTGQTELFEPFAKTARLALQHLLRPAEQRLVPQLRWRAYRHDRRQERPDHALSDADASARDRAAAASTTRAGVWFAEFVGERVGMFDTKTERFKEWEVPGRFFAPYDVAHDKLGNVWTGGMNADRILRINIESGEVTEYPLPHATNVRRVFVDNNTTPPTFWVGNNHGAALIKLEPQD